VTLLLSSIADKVTNSAIEKECMIALTLISAYLSANADSTRSCCVEVDVVDSWLSDWERDGDAGKAGRFCADLAELTTPTNRSLVKSMEHAVVTLAISKNDWVTKWAVRSPNRVNDDTVDTARAIGGGSSVASCWRGPVYGSTDDDDSGRWAMCCRLRLFVSPAKEKTA
jgi:hypothetical protein